MLLLFVLVSDLNQSQTISLYFPLLHAIAMKMVGSIADAEDIVHDTFLKWLTIDHKKIENTKSYLIKAVTNNCINHLNTASRKKNEYIEALSPGDLIEKYKEREVFQFDLENELSAALGVLQKKLEPIEKGIYILREVFSFDYEDLQDIFDKKKDNCRQLFFRAKEKLNQETKKIKIDTPVNGHLLENFKLGCILGHPSEYINDILKEVAVKLSNKGLEKK